MEEIKNIPLICPNFNQVTYLKNLILWWKWYYPENPVIVIDNNSDSEDLKDYYADIDLLEGYDIIHYPENDCANNLRIALKHLKEYEYFVISDPDIMPHPATPPYFLEVFKHLIDEHKFHHAGFGLVYEDIPDWNHEKDFIQNNEKQFATEQNGAPAEHLIHKSSGELIPFSRFKSAEQAIAIAHRSPEIYGIVNEKQSNLYKFKYEGEMLAGFKAPIDTTFAMYTTKNSGWHAPMNGADWSNSIRIFKSFHLPWYLAPGHINDEMRHYFKTARYWEPGDISAGINHNRPLEFIKTDK